MGVLTCYENVLYKWESSYGNIYHIYVQKIYGDTCKIKILVPPKYTGGAIKTVSKGSSITPYTDLKIEYTKYSIVSQTVMVATLTITEPTSSKDPGFSDTGSSDTDSVIDKIASDVESGASSFLSSLKSLFSGASSEGISGVLILVFILFLLLWSVQGYTTRK